MNWVPYPSNNKDLVLVLELHPLFHIKIILSEILLHMHTHTHGHRYTRKTLFTSNACSCRPRNTEIRSTSRGAVVVVAVVCVSSEELLLLSRTRIDDTEEPNESDELTLVWDERLMMRRRLVFER